MNWNEKKELIKNLRKESIRLSRKHGTAVWCDFQLEAPCYPDYHNTETGIFLINPWGMNLKTGDYYGLCLLCGKRNATNLKTEEVIKDAV